jgi:hypothetical protein
MLLYPVDRINEDLGLRLGARENLDTLKELWLVDAFFKAHSSLTPRR